jgi:hypothetical protein
MLAPQVFRHGSASESPSPLPRGEDQDEACGELPEFTGAVAANRGGRVTLVSGSEGLSLRSMPRIAGDF